ncbi:helix-turn-helix domain-containing protein [Solibacillus isronensis]
MEKVNCIKRQRRYKARDKEELIFSIIQLHNQGYSQVDIAKILNISRGFY